MYDSIKRLRNTSENQNATLFIPMQQDVSNLSSQTINYRSHTSLFNFSWGATISLAAWFLTNITTVVLNKYIYTFMGFRFPVTLTTIHMFTCTLGSLIAIHVLKITPWYRADKDTLLKKLLPLSFLFVINIVLGNVSLRWVPVSFMQTVKASVPVFSVVLQVLLMGRSFSRQVYLSLIPIVGGVVLATYTESEYNATGFYAALLSSMITALVAIVSSLTLSKQLNSLNVLYYMAPISTVMLLPVAWISEGADVEMWYTETSLTFHYTSLLISGVIAYLLNITTFLVIAHTSALTYNVAGNFKVAFSILFSVWVFGNTVVFWNGLGCFIAIVGVAYYNVIR